MKKQKKELTSMELKKRKKRRNRIIAVAVVVVLIIIRLVACGGSGTQAAIVNTANPLYGDVEETINISGTIESEIAKVYFSQVTGKVEAVHVELGDLVEEGDALVTYNMEEMQRRLNEATLQSQVNFSNYQGTMAQNSQSQNKLTEANINLSILNQQISDTEKYIKVLQESLENQQRDTANSLAAESLALNQKVSDLTSQLETLTPGSDEFKQKSSELSEAQKALSRNQYASSVANSTESVVSLQKKIQEQQEILAGYQEYKAKMESQKNTSEATVLDQYDKQVQSANYELAASSLRNIQDEYNAAAQGVRAEFTGIVTEVTTISGAPVTEGSQLITMKSSENIKVVISVSKYDLQKLEIGQLVDLTISGHQYTGTVSKINRMATINVTGTAAIGAEIHIDNPDDNIYLGIEAKAEIHTHKAEHVLLLPIEAVNADRDGDFVYIVENGKAVRKSVVTGISSDIYIEIKEGLTDADSVIVSSYSSVEEGMAVTVMPTE